MDEKPGRWQTPGKKKKKEGKRDDNILHIYLTEYLQLVGIR